MPQHALVTGGTGFIGRRVVARFLDAGWRVTSLSLPGESVAAAWQGRATVRHGDLTADDCDAALPVDADVIVHLASPVGIAGEYERQWQIMVGGTERICALAERAHARLVVVSSIAVYGDSIQHDICTEDTPHGAWQGAYGRAKQGQESAALRWSDRTGLPLTLIRPANVYGLGGSSAWGDRLLALIRSTGGAVIGDADRNDAGLVYVENLADALWLAATHPRAIGQTYNVCDGEPITWRRFNDDMAELVGRSPPPGYPLKTVRAMAHANEDPANLVPPRDPTLPFLEALNLVGYSNRIDSSRIRRELGWAPRVSYADALRDMRAMLA